MQKKLLMLVCSTSHESPWFATQGSEQCIKVKGLGDGDQVVLDVEGESSRDLENGLNSVHGATLGKRYKIRKISGTKPVPTTVEVFF